MKEKTTSQLERPKPPKDRAEKKVQIAIDKMIDLQDAGFGCDAATRILEQLNALRHRIVEW